MKMKRKRNWLVVVLVATIALGLMTGVAVAGSSILAGNATIERDYVDGWSNHYIVDKNNAFSSDSIVTDWKIYAKSQNSVGFMIYRFEDDGWKVIYNGDDTLSTPDFIGVHTYQLSNAVGVKAGDFVGLYFGDGAGVVPFTMIGDYTGADPGTATMQGTPQNGDPIEFTYHSYRTYSVQALGIAKPSSIWLPPISLDHFELNERATLPIKFQLNGFNDMFDEISLKVNGENIPLIYEEDEDNGYFHLGLFRPSEAGEFTAKIYFLGVEIDSKTFNVFQAAANAKGQSK